MDGAPLRSGASAAPTTHSPDLPQRIGAGAGPSVRAARFSARAVALVEREVERKLLRMHSARKEMP